MEHSPKACSPADSPTSTAHASGASPPSPDGASCQAIDRQEEAAAALAALTPDDSPDADGPGMSNSSGSRAAASSEDSPASCQELHSVYLGAQESPIRGLIIPEHPAESRAIAERVGSILRHDISLCAGHHGQDCNSRSDRASQLQSQLLEYCKLEDSASSCGHPAEPELATLAAGLEPAQQPADAAAAERELGTSAEDPASLGGAGDGNIKSTEGSIAPDCVEEQASVQICAMPEGIASTAPAGGCEGSQASSSTGWPAPVYMQQSSEDPVLLTKPVAALSASRATGRSKAGSLLPVIRALTIQALLPLLGGGVVLLAWLAALRWSGGILKALKILIRAFRLYQETMQRLK